MPNHDVSLLVVDDTKFSSAMVNRVITSAGYKDIRHAHSASDALRLIEERPASILIADWLMPEMDGLELTQRIRQIDEANNHFTYVILLTGKEGLEAMTQAFDQGVDDFVNKSAMNEQLLPRTLAAERIASMQNRLLIENQSLIDANARLKQHSTHDALTGLGNLHYAQKRLDETIRHVSSRGGAACVMLLTVSNFDSMRKQYGATIAGQLLIACARRLRQLVRPLDVVTRIAPNQFAIITHHPHAESVNAQSFRRVHDGINLKAYKTSAGFISIKATLNIASTTEQLKPPTAETLLEMARQDVARATETGTVILNRYEPVLA